VTAPKVGIVVLTWNDREDTLECLASLERLTYAPAPIFLVDNGSTDGSVEAFEKLSRPAFRLLRNRENLGYAAGNNAGIRAALADGCRYVWILNNDAMPEPGSLARLVEFMEAHPRAAMCGPTILQPGRDVPSQQHPRRRIGLSAMLLLHTPLHVLVRRFGSFDHLWASDRGPGEVYTVQGSCMLLRREFLEARGLLDERTFLYWEEPILGERMRGTDWGAYYVPEAVVRHKLARAVLRIGPWHYIERTRSERYFAWRYLRLSAGLVWFLGAIRLLVYSARSVYRPAYRRLYGEFLRALAGGSWRNRPR
jgi:GT2 family glycosyltransferase